MKTSFGEFLALRRKEKGLTQKELASKLFVSESTVSKWEQNRANPDITVLPILSEILEVSEHELITASVDNTQRENNIKARKWNTLSFSWNLFFLISYGITLLACFITDLATGGGLTWFWIVLSALILSATFTTLPNYVRKFKLLIITLSELLSLILLLGVCCIYTSGNWFFIATLPVICGFSIVFLPIYINTYNLPKFIKSHYELLCLIINIPILLIMIYILESYTVTNAYAEVKWATPLALPLTFAGVVLSALVIVSIKYIPVLKSFKTGIVLTEFAIATFCFRYIIDVLMNKVFEIAMPESYMPNLFMWNETYVDKNVQFIILTTLIVLAVTFFGIGTVKTIKSKNK